MIWEGLACALILTRLAQADASWPPQIEMRVPGSLRVKVGDRVRRGQLLAIIGDSGGAREPHLHFQVSTSPDLLAGEGVPSLIDQYGLKSTSAVWEMRTRELPLGGTLVDFSAAFK